jgi:hypothetical protein
VKEGSIRHGFNVSRLAHNGDKKLLHLASGPDNVCLTVSQKAGLRLVLELSTGALQLNYGEFHALKWTLETCGSSTEQEWVVTEVEMAFVCFRLVGPAALMFHSASQTVDHWIVPTIKKGLSPGMCGSTAFPWSS